MVKHGEGGNKLPILVIKVHRCRKLGIHRCLKEGSVKLFLAAITKSSQMYNRHSGFAVRMGYASKGGLARKQGDL